MSFNDDSNDSNWNVFPSKTKKETVKDPNATPKKAKDTIRRFSDKWFELFSPWLSRCEEYPDKPFCRACQTKLDNNKFRLRRHENTAKHARNLEILLNSGEMGVIECLSQRKKKVKGHHGLDKIKTEPKASSFSTLDTETSLYESKFSPKKRMIPKNEAARYTSIPSIEQVDLDLYYRSLEREQRRDMTMRDYYYGAPQPKKDSFDMFFDAISASVKALPPKLAAEVKSRVSQLVAEFELRAICEKEAQEKAQQSMVTTLPTQVANVVTIDSTMISGSSEKPTSDGNAVTQYVYSYQPKI